MGQRHQIFLIARVRAHGAPPNHSGKRRCIAALHHQWCYGSLPLTAMRPLVTLVGQPDNAAIIRAEVRNIQGKYGSHNAVKPPIPNVPCPFAAALLAMAWTADLQDGANIYSSGTTLGNDLLEASMGCWDGDNNDGLSILDVTDPEKPAYCFLSGPETPGTPEQYTAPLDARGYLSVYYKLDKPVDDKADAGSKEADSKRAQYKYWMTAIDDLADVAVLPKSPQTHPAPPSQPAPEPSDISHGAVPNLADMSLDVAVKQSIEDGDTAEVEKLLWLPGKAARVKAILRELDHFTDSMVQLLAITLKELHEIPRVDLVGFRMSGAHVAAVLSALGDVHSVDLSGNGAIVSDDIPDILAATPTLRRIALMDCPSVDGARLLELVQTQPSRFKTVEGILHPAFLTIKKSDPYPCAFTYVSVTSMQGLACVSIPFFTPAQVVQALTDIIPWQGGSRSGTMFGQYGLPCVGTSAFQGGTRQPGQKVNERTIMSVPLQSSRIPRGPRSLWTFVCNMPQFHFHGTDKGWGFVHYTHEEPGDGSVGSTDATSAVEKGGQYGTGTVYDLKGFLECMAKEGRPMPSDEAVEKLQKILYMAESGLDDDYGEAEEASAVPVPGGNPPQYLCPLMKQESLSVIIR
ncbi:hypothetical protein K466DRAFT_668274 [Polyporus arcularius HHB13444]|uniref:RNI-like protein n=1 Tax=Polyporus arcularius HHB13444 TaxID=1314778 RepID=A0A5C3NQF1_9APHY|nr:hypothetical protein K466DRAFT_668274 [Polyporus arcularius HHB13444]